MPLYILFLGALVSAILSTLSGALLVAGSLLAHNVVAPLFPRVRESGRVGLDRAAVVLFGVLAYAIALTSESIYALVQESPPLAQRASWCCSSSGCGCRASARDQAPMRRWSSAR